MHGFTNPSKRLRAQLRHTDVHNLPIRCHGVAKRALSKRDYSGSGRVVTFFIGRNEGYKLFPNG